MTPILKRPNWMLAIGLPLLVMIGCTVITFSPVFLWNESRMATGITLDLTVTAPFLYFLAIRKTRVPRMTVVRVFMAGLLLAGLLLNHRSRSLLDGIKTWVAPAVEALLIIALVRKFYKARRSPAGAGGSRLAGGDFLSQARALAVAVTGNERIGHVLASEIAVCYYAIAGRPQKDINYRDSFSTYKTSGVLPILGVFLFCILAETTGLHFLIGMWSHKAAWILTALSVYTLLQLYAHMRAIKARPVRIEGGILHLRHGLVADAGIPLEDIEQIHITRKTDPGEKAEKLALFKGLESHNIRITCRQPVSVLRLFGIRKQAVCVLFFVDRPEDLLQAVQDAKTQEVK